MTTRFERVTTLDQVVALCRAMLAAEALAQSLAKTGIIPDLAWSKAYLLSHDLKKVFCETFGADDPDMVHVSVQRGEVSRRFLDFDPVFAADTLTESGLAALETP